MTTMRALLTEMKRLDGEANESYACEDFNSTLLIYGVTGSFAFEMHRCDREFIVALRNASPVLIEACIRMMDALKRECCCPGELDYDGKSILCDPCETLNALDALARGDGK